MRSIAALAAVLLAALLSASCGGNSKPGTDSPSLTAAPPNGEISLLGSQGTRIVDARGSSVSLVGVNLGGWLLWEGWIWGGGLVGEQSIRSHMAELVGQADVDAFAQRVH